MCLYGRCRSPHIVTSSTMAKHIQNHNGSYHCKQLLLVSSCYTSDLMPAPCRNTWLSLFSTRSSAARDFLMILFRDLTAIQASESRN